MIFGDIDGTCVITKDKNMTKKLTGSTSAFPIDFTISIVSIRKAYEF